MASRDYFKNKRIAVIGLGNNGELVEDVKFLIKSGAIVSVYDLKSEARLKNHLVFLRSVGLANYVCGSIPVDDLLDMDIIILSHDYTKEAKFLESVRNASKPILIEYPETLFLKQSPPVTIVGVIGAYGKSSLVSMLAPLLDTACAHSDEQKFFLIDSESNDGSIAHLKRIRNGDIILIKINDILMKEMYNMRLSPHVAVFTSLPIDESYDKSPFEILSYQTYNNFIVASDEIVDMTHSLNVQPKAKMLRTKPAIVPADWGLDEKYRVHEKSNIALAFQTANLFKLDNDRIWNLLSRWKSLRGRLEFVKKVKNIEFYNDSASVTPDSTKFAIQTLAKDKNIILIMGGSKAKGCYGPLYEEMPKFVKKIILLPGSGTILERKSIQKIPDIEIISAPTLEEAVRISMERAIKGDIVLFSPGFESVGYGSRKERGERFVRAVRNL